MQPHGPKAPGGDCLKERRVLQRTRACMWTDGVSTQHMRSTRGAHAERSVHGASSRCSKRSWAAEGAGDAYQHGTPSAVGPTQRGDRSLHLRGRRDSTAANDTIGEPGLHVMVRVATRAPAAWDCVRKQGQVAGLACSHMPCTQGAAEQSKEAARSRRYSRRGRGIKRRPTWRCPGGRAAGRRQELPLSRRCAVSRPCRPCRSGASARSSEPSASCGCYHCFAIVSK